MATKKSGTKPTKTGEALRKEAIAVADANIAAIEAKERGEQAPASGDAKPKQKKSPTSAKGAPAPGKPSKAENPAKTQRAQTSAAKVAKAQTPKSQKAPKPAKEKRMSGLDHAANVLAASKEPQNAVAIAERAIAAGWKTEGATPHATLYSAIIREIATKGSESRFKKLDRGLFTTTSKGGK